MKNEQDDFSVMINIVFQTESFGVSTREFLRIHTYGEVNKNPIYGSIVVIISIILVTMFLLLAPGSVQPIASYIAFSLLLLLPMIFVLFVFCNHLKKKYLSPQIPNNETLDDNQTCDEIRRQSSVPTIHTPDIHKLSICSTPSRIASPVPNVFRKTSSPNV